MVQLSTEHLGLRYLRVANSLREKIQSGVYRVGDRLPRQHDLAKDYGVAFSTLKQALDVLDREGYVVRKVGQGTYATLPEKHVPLALVVDDDKRIRQSMERALAQIGWNSITAESGPMALEKLKEHRFDLVLLDLIMPRMNGADTFREIRSMDPDASVVIITGYPESSAMAEALQIGPFGVMKKPFTRNQLRLVLRNVEILTQNDGIRPR